MTTISNALYLLSLLLGVAYFIEKFRVRPALPPLWPLVVALVLMVASAITAWAA